MATRRSSPCNLLITVLHTNREHRRDVYATLGSSATCLTLRAFRAAPCSPSVLEISKSSGTKCHGKAFLEKTVPQGTYDRAQLIPEVFFVGGHTCTNHTVPYGTALWGGAVPGTSCQATIASSLRDISQQPLAGKLRQSGPSSYSSFVFEFPVQALQPSL